MLLPRSDASVRRVPEHARAEGDAVEGHTSAHIGSLALAALRVNLEQGEALLGVYGEEADAVGQTAGALLRGHALGCAPGVLDV